MMADTLLSYAKTAGIRWRRTSSRSRCWPLLLIIAILPELMGFIMLRHSITEAISPALLIPLEHAPGFPKRGSVTTMANLRSAPSMQSEVVSTIKEGMPIEILTETGRWYRVKTEEGMEAWIGKSLVIVEPAPRKVPSPVSVTVIPSEIQTLEERPSPASVMADAPPETAILLSENTTDPKGTGASPGLPEEAPPISPQGAEFNWSIAGILPYVQGIEAYVIPALVIVLILAFSFQLKAARQLRRAMQEMGVILDLVDDIYANGLLPRTDDGKAMTKALSKSTSRPQPETPSVQFSALEHTMLQAMSDHREIGERELTEALAAKGFVGVLIKAVIGGIIRKTKASGQQCIDVRYVQGRYRYQLRREGVSILRNSG
jgi:hypothetical protein